LPTGCFDNMLGALTSRVRIPATAHVTMCPHMIIVRARNNGGYHRTVFSYTSSYTCAFAGVFAHSSSVAFTPLARDRARTMYPRRSTHSANEPARAWRCMNCTFALKIPSFEPILGSARRAPQRDAPIVVCVSFARAKGTR
jgi:hypothetical protein